MVLEVSGNYSIILPVILANTIAYLLSRVLTPVPIFEVFTLQDGLDLPSMEEQREENPRHIEDALRPVNVPILEETNTLAQAAAVMLSPQPSKTRPDRNTDVLLVRLSDGSWYVLTAAELTEALNTLPSDAQLKHAVKSDRAPLLFPDMPLDSTLPHFVRWPLLPIRNRAMKGHLEGIITSDDVLHTYQQQ
jgi:CIC family chloride channel protein